MDASNLGALKRKPDERDVLLGSVQAPVSIPATFITDMSWFVRNFQGQTPYCGAHASSHLKAILDRAQNPETAPHYTPRFSWIRIKQIDGKPLANGTDMRSIFKSLQNDGANEFEPLENDVSLPIETYSELSAITPYMTTDAKPRVIASYAFGTTDFASLCQHIYQNKAVLLLIHCDDGFWGTSTPTFTTTPYTHFVTAYNYDAENLYVVDSADPNPDYAFKKINKQYVTPTFFLESGTALDIPPPAAVAPIVQAAADVVTGISQSSEPVPVKQTLLGEVEQALQEIEEIL